MHNALLLTSNHKDEQNSQPDEFYTEYSSSLKGDNRGRKYLVSLIWYKATQYKRGWRRHTSCLQIQQWVHYTIYISLLQVKKKRAMKLNTVVSSNKKQYLHSVIKWYKSLLLEKWLTPDFLMQLGKGASLPRVQNKRLVPMWNQTIAKHFPALLAMRSWCDFLTYCARCISLENEMRKTKNKSSRGVSSVFRYDDCQVIRRKWHVQRQNKTHKRRIT